MFRLITGLLVLTLVVTPAASQDQQWGTIKGQIVFTGDAPAAKELNVDKDKDHCLSKGKILSDQIVVDKTTKGVKWAVVWLVDANDAKAKLPIHPSLKDFPKKASFDQPCCVFEPHVLAIRAGQIVEAKNSSPIPHNVDVKSFGKNPNLNQIIPPGKSLEIDPWYGSASPTTVACSIHPWMQMYIRVFDHPYYAVTDAQGKFEIKNAPAGNYKIVVWHETGYVVGDKTGVPIKIEAGKDTDFPVKMNPPAK